MAASHAPRLDVRRGGWALPAEPPEKWIGAGWAGALLVSLVVVTVVPVAVLINGAIRPSPTLTGIHVLAGIAAVLSSYLLLVQASVTGDVRLRWLAGGYALLAVVVVSRALVIRGPSADGAASDALLNRSAAVSLAWQLVLPIAVLTAEMARRSLLLIAVPVVVVAGPATVALLYPDALPRLIDDGHFTTALNVASGVVAALAAIAAFIWWRRSPLGINGPWGLVLAGLAIAPLVGVLRALVDRRYDDLWWSSVAVEDLALVVPALGLLAHGSTRYFRQARRWRQLEEEVRALRTATALLPGRSVTPEDEAGLPSEPDVRELVEQRRLKIALQPVVELGSGLVVGHEALSRFGGRTPTDRWFRAASRYGLGGELEQVTLQVALALLDNLPEPGFLAVNVSPAALTDPIVLGLLHDCDLSRIVVEVTEHEAVADYPAARAALDRLRADGARIAVDDTGAGFASLRHVLLLQPDIIKLDTSITRDVENDTRQQALVKALMSFAKEVGSEVLAEGVETEDQRQALMEIGVPIGQGWHLGLPVTQD